MIAFVVIGMVMLGSALWILLWPLVTRTTRTTIPRHELNVRIAQQRLEELQNELKNELLSETEFNTTQTDLEDSLLTDIESEEKICETLNNLRGKVSILIVSHSENVLKICDRVIYLEGNSIISTDSSSKIES